MTPPTTPEPASQERSIWERLQDYYTPGEAHLWLILPHPQLSDIPPAQMLAMGYDEPVRAILDRLDGDGYL